MPTKKPTTYTPTASRHLAAVEAWLIARGQVSPEMVKASDALSALRDRLPTPWTPAQIAANPSAPEALASTIWNAMADPSAQGRLFRAHNEIASVPQRAVDAAVEAQAAATKDARVAEFTARIKVAANRWAEASRGVDGATINNPGSNPAVMRAVADVHEAYAELKAAAVEGKTERIELFPALPNTIEAALGQTFAVETAEERDARLAAEAEKVQEKAKKPRRAVFTIS